MFERFDYNEPPIYHEKFPDEPLSFCACLIVTQTISSVVTTKGWFTLLLNSMDIHIKWRNHQIHELNELKETRFLSEVFTLWFYHS